MITKQIKVNITARDAKLETVKADGNVPAVFYGPQEESVPVNVNAREFTKVWGEAGESTIVVLSGVGDDKEALIKDVQWHPLTDEAVHIDFYVIERGKKLTMSVPLEFTGEAPAEKLGGNVNKVLHELEIEVRPSDIPQSIEVDLTKLVDMQSVITVGDLQLPESAETTLEANYAVASVSEAVEEDLSAPVGDAMPEDLTTEDGDHPEGDTEAEPAEKTDE
ncbi:MAG: 50S ribosomal protein L25 [Candidatus Pacebacteria bacterium]|nr:50S ribosomal protein L25 [Candidatus Paceibacterota bacterium]